MDEMYFVGVVNLWSLDFTRHLPDTRSGSEQTDIWVWQVVSDHFILGA